MAAATRSSSMSLSSPTRLGSISTRRTSYLQVIRTLTMPPPAWPSTSVDASSSCAFCMLACISCACRINWPKPFMNSSSRCDMWFAAFPTRGGGAGSLGAVPRLDRIRFKDGTEGFLSRPDVRVLLHRFAGPAHALVLVREPNLRGCRPRRLARRDRERDRAAEVLADRRLEPRTHVLRRPQLLLRHEAQREAPLPNLPGLAMLRELSCGAADARGLAQRAPAADPRMRRRRGAPRVRGQRALARRVVSEAGAVRRRACRAERHRRGLVRMHGVGPVRLGRRRRRPAVLDVGPPLRLRRRRGSGCIRPRLPLELLG